MGAVSKLARRAEDGDCPKIVEKLLYRPKEAAQMLGIGRATLYELMHAGKIRSVKDGSMRFITLEALRDYVRQLEDQAQDVA
jgi:excisionase family DNA binding protein